MSIDSCECAAGAVLQAPALSSKCGQRHAEIRRRRLYKNLFKSVQLGSCAVNDAFLGCRLAWV